MSMRIAAIPYVQTSVQFEWSKNNKHRQQQEEYTVYMYVNVRIFFIFELFHTLHSTVQYSATRNSTTKYEEEEIPATEKPNELKNPYGNNNNDAGNVKVYRWNEFF
ncbi:hypothetical protein DERP_009744 [Dermatophagoides pteronyssinus]|uniref:Uncharacterized protein n=1 Tax=Dermatophagoides pteronyssinus TaxID=6956 RepID=A0ABQ8IR16_DERPT|nr:hypothetical protein DERP_009744 [Dermatophagoides pteronyssinus]